MVITIYNKKWKLLDILLTWHKIEYRFFFSVSEVQLEIFWLKKMFYINTCFHSEKMKETKKKQNNKTQTLFFLGGKHII